MGPYKSPGLKKVMHGSSKDIAQPEYRAIGVCPRTQMPDLPQKFERMPFLLQGIFFRVGITEDFDLRNFYLKSLSFSR
jgi:hypothetical protein